MNVSGQFLADRYGVDLRTVQRWAKTGLIERLERDSYVLASADLYFIDKLRGDISKMSATSLDQDANNLPAKKLQAEIRKLEAEAAIKELDLEERKGGLVAYGEAKNTFGNVLMQAKSKFLSIPARLSLELSGMSDPRLIAALLQSVIDEALNDLSAGLKQGDSADEKEFTE